MKSSSKIMRDQILNSIRRELGREELSSVEKSKLDSRLKGRTINMIPARSSGTHEEKINLFKKMAKEAHATVVNVVSNIDVPNAVSAYLAQNNLPSDIVMTLDKNLDVYPWEAIPLLNISRRKAENLDKVSVTGADMGFAETGTLMLTSSTDRPSTLNFLPDHHIVVIESSKIRGAYEEGWDHLRTDKNFEGVMPRTVNLITGPSRTGDVEQTMQLGAHGPRQLHIIIVGS
jgi:L-lactate dehydrogenase complex protein LldG